MNAVIQRSDSSIIETFIEVLKLFSDSNSSIKFDSSIYSYPVLQDSKIEEIIKMLNDNVSISGCCKFISSYFTFDPAYVNAIENHQLSRQECRLGLIANTIAWIGIDRVCDSDYFLLLIRAITSENIDRIRKFCISIMIEHYKHFLKFEISDESASLLMQYLVASDYSLLDFSYTIGIIQDLLSISLKGNMKEITNISLRALSTLISNNPELFAQYDFQNIIQYCDGAFKDLNLEALSLLRFLSDSTKTDLSSCFSDLAIYVLQKFSTNGTNLELDTLTPENIFSEFITDFQMNFETFKLCPQNLNALSIGAFDASINYSHLLDTPKFEILTAFKPLLDLTKSRFIEVFLKKISKQLPNYYCIETITFYISILHNINSNLISSIEFEVLENSVIFSPEYTIFFSNHDNKFSILNFLRHSIFSLLFSIFTDKLSPFLSKSAIYPFLFAENFARFYSLASVSKRIDFLTPELISNISLVLQKLILQMSKKSNDWEQVHTAWSTVFTCVHDLLSNPATAPPFFSSFDFINVYMRHFFHPTLRPLVFSSLQRYLLLPNSYIASIAQFCLSLFQFGLSSDNQFHSIITELLACLEDAIVHKQEILHELSVIIPALISFFLNYPSKELLKSTLNFLLLASFNINDFMFSHDEMLSLGKTIRSMENRELSDNTFSILLSLLAGTKITNSSQAFTIKNPSFILLIMIVFAEDVSRPILFFHMLCKYSIFNCIQCQKGELDLILIELIRNFPEQFTYLDCVFKSSFSKNDLSSIVIQLLSLIFEYQCSPQSFEKFIGLMVPIHNSKSERIMASYSIEKDNIYQYNDVFSSFNDEDVSFPQFSDEVMNLLIQNMTNIRELHYVFTPNCDPIKFNDINFDEIENGFTFACHLMVDSAISQDFSEKPLLFKIKDASKAAIVVYATGSSLLCEIFSSLGNISVSLTTELPSCQWVMITITIRRKNESYLLLEFSSNKSPRPPFTIRDPHFTGAKLSVQIGGYMPNSEITNNVSFFLGPFHLFNSPLNSQNIGLLYSLGAKELNDVKDLLLMQSSVQVCTSYIRNFLYIFKKYNLIKCLIPFFGFTKSSPNFFIERIVDFFRYVDPKQSNEYYSIISQFLVKSQPSTIQYSLYLRFFNLYSETLSDQLFKYILFNFDIWFNAEDPKTVKRIVQHWTNVLFPDFPQNFTANTSFSEILTLIRIHCWYTDCESNMINKNRCKNIDIEEIRLILNKLLTKLALNKLSQFEVRSILSNIFTIHDVQQKLSLLNLLKDISRLVYEKKSVASELHMLFTTPRTDIFSMTFELVLKFASDIGFPTLCKHINYIMFHINKQHLTTSILNSIIKASEKFPVAITIACLIACNLPEVDKLSTIEAFADIIGKSSKETQSSFSNLFGWFIWPILLTLKITSSKYYQSLSIKTISRIILANKFKADNVLAFLDLIYLTYNIKVTTIQLQILEEICTEFTNSQNDMTENEINEFLYKLARYLLFKFDRQIHSFELINRFNSSPFRNEQSDSLVTSIPYLSNNIVNASEGFDNMILVGSRQRTKSSNFNFYILSMSEVIKLFSPKQVKPDLIFRVDIDNENKEILDKILALIDQIKISRISNPNTLNYFRFFKYLKNRTLFGDNEKFQFLNVFSSESLRSFQVMSISFKNFFNRFCYDFDKYFFKTKVHSENLLSNLSNETLQISLTSSDLMRERKLAQYASDANLFNYFAFQNMNDFSIWNQFFTNIKSHMLVKEGKSFDLIEDFSCPFVKTKTKLFNIEIDPLTIKTKPIMVKSSIYIQINSYQDCKFIIFPASIMIVTKTKRITIPVDELTYVLYRPLNSFEFVKKSGKTYVIQFRGATVEEVAHSLNQMSVFVDVPLPKIQNTSLLKFFHKLSFTNDWVNRRISNFQYLLKLNFFGGRSYHLLHNYPIFPFIRDFSLNTIGYKILPQVWLKMFPPFASCFDSRQIILKTSDEDKVQFDVKLTFDNSNDLCEEDEKIDENLLSSEIPNNESDDSISFTSEHFLSTLELNKYELTPEFYLMPECFANLNLPNGISKYDFIYENRKKLESDEVSENLNIWIDKVFGSSGIATCLFKSQHPTRKVQKSDSFTSQFYHKLTLENIIFGKMKVPNHDELVVKIISSQGNCSEYLVDLDQKTVEIQSQVSIKITPQTIISTSSDEFLLIDTSKSILSVVKGQKIHQTAIQLSAEFCEDSGIFGSHNGIVFSVETDNTKCYLLGQAKVYPEKIVSIASSIKFNKIIVAVRSGKIILYDRRNGKYIRTVADYGLAAKRILITESFGFIIAEYSKEIALFSMNGEKIRSIEIEYNIAFLKSYVSEDGFDYLIIADRKGKILVYDAFKLTVVKEIDQKLSCGIIDIVYHPRLQSFVLFTQDGRIFTIK